MDEEREDAEEAFNEAKISAPTVTESTASTGSGSGSSGKTQKEIIKDQTGFAVSMGKIHSGSRLVSGRHLEGDTADAAVLADAIDEAVGTGKLGQDKLTVAELQLLDDISRGSVVRHIVSRCRV